MISGAFVALAVLKYGISKLRREELSGEYQDWAASRLWELTLKFFVPLAATILLLWWFYLSVTEYAPTQWFNPFNSYSIMTCVVQWVLMLSLFIIFNKRIARSMLALK
jgi:NSS family neurotransmitter:Na+ symporter